MKVYPNREGNQRRREVHETPSQKRPRCVSGTIQSKVSPGRWFMGYKHQALLQAKTLEAEGFETMTISAFPIDLVEHIIEFLDLRSTVSLLTTSRSAALSKEWVYKLWKRACTARWVYKPIDNGSGAGLALDLNRPDWFRAALAREWIEMQLEAGASGSDKIKTIVEIIAKQPSNSNVLEEGCRWMVEIFDHTEERYLSRAALNERSAKNLISGVSRLSTSGSCQHLAVKAFGILALNEVNRQMLPKFGVVQLIVKAMRKHQFNSDLMENALWALVIFGRPLGCNEGSRFMNDRLSSVSNISEYMSEDVVMAVLSAAKRYITNSSVLTKVFWAMVNLALIDTNKEYLVSNRAVHLILFSMNKFPNEHLLQFRACFALINLSLNRDARDLIRSLNGIETVLASMKRFEDFAMLQRCGCNILMSMAWASSANRERMIKLKASDVIERARSRHGSLADLNQIASSLLSML